MHKRDGTFTPFVLSILQLMVCPPPPPHTYTHVQHDQATELISKLLHDMDLSLYQHNFIACDRFRIQEPRSEWNTISFSILEDRKKYYGYSCIRNISFDFLNNGLKSRMYYSDTRESGIFLDIRTL